MIVCRLSSGESVWYNGDGRAYSLLEPEQRGRTMQEQRRDPAGSAIRARDEDRRLWWQKLADGIADAICGAIRVCIELLKAWNWRSRWWWKDYDDL